MSYTAPLPIRNTGAGNPQNSALNYMNGNTEIHHSLMKAATGGKKKRIGGGVGGVEVPVITPLYPGGNTTGVTVATTTAHSAAHTQSQTDKVELLKGGMGRSRRTRYTKRSRKGRKGRKGRNGRKSRRSKRTRRM